MKNNKRGQDKSFKFNKSAKIVILIGLSPIILFMVLNIFLVIINHGFGEMDCLRKTRYEELEFSGRIIEKNQDSKSHMQEYIEIIDSSSEKRRIYLSSKQNQLWNKLELNDYIKKNKNLLEFIITRKEKDFIIETKFECGVDDFWLDPYN